jgi:hypothetical protein
MLILFLICILVTLVTVHRASCYRYSSMGYRPQGQLLEVQKHGLPSTGGPAVTGTVAWVTFHRGANCYRYSSMGYLPQGGQLLQVQKHGLPSTGGPAVTGTVAWVTFHRASCYSTVAWVTVHRASCYIGTVAWVTIHSASCYRYSNMGYRTQGQRLGLPAVTGTVARVTVHRASCYGQQALLSTGPAVTRTVTWDPIWLHAFGS